MAPGLRAVQNLLAGWDGLGWEWTGTDTELRSAEWLARLTSEAGLDVAIERYPFERVDVTQCRVESGTHHALGLPLFDGGGTGAAGVTGALTPAAGDGDIAVLEVAPWDSQAERLRAARSDVRYKAVIVITRSGSEGLAPLDVATPLGRKPQPKPVLEIGSEHRLWLLDAAESHAQATIVADFARSPAEGRNVIAVWSGTDRSLAPLVVLAGRSGWGPCVAERGGGLVCMVHAAQALSQTAASRTVIFAATSGCELGNIGLGAFLERYPQLKGEALGWIELGPNLGSRNGVAELSGKQAAWLELLRSRLNIEQARWRMAERAEATETDPATPAVATGRGSLDASAVRTDARGIDARGLVLDAAAGTTYHLPLDQLPSSIDLSQMLALSKAFTSTLLELAQP